MLSLKLIHYHLIGTIWDNNVPILANWPMRLLELILDGLGVINQTDKKNVNYCGGQKSLNWF